MEKRFTNLNALDELFVANGLVVATGWCDSPFAPKIAVAGRILPEQMVVRDDRPDVPAVHPSVPLKSGFRICAFLPEPCDHSSIEVIFADGTALRAQPAKLGKLDQLIMRFRELVKEKPDGHMIEIGSRARSGNSYRHLFEGLKNYTGLDITDGPNVDVVGDAHRLSKVAKTKFDFAFSVSVFEHLIMPWVAAYELSLVMKIGGYGYIQSHPAWPLHEVPWDFFRFSEHAWHGLFNSYTGFEIVDCGYQLPAMIAGRTLGGPSVQGLDRQETYLLSGCLIKKTSEPSVDWFCDVSKIYDLAYSHGQK